MVAYTLNCITWEAVITDPLDFEIILVYTMNSKPDRDTQGDLKKKNKVVLEFNKLHS